MRVYTHSEILADNNFITTVEERWNAHGLNVPPPELIPASHKETGSQQIVTG